MIRSRFEHVFADQKSQMGLFIRTVGITRATMRIGLANILYNMRCFLFLERLNTSASSSSREAVPVLLKTQIKSDPKNRQSARQKPKIRALVGSECGPMATRVRAKVCSPTGKRYFRRCFEVVSLGHCQRSFLMSVLCPEYHRVVGAKTLTNAVECDRAGAFSVRRLSRPF